MTPRGRPFLGVIFKCCHVYARVYRNEGGTAYEGRCPRCLRSLVVRIDRGGSHQRFLAAVPRVTAMN